MAMVNIRRNTLRYCALRAVPWGIVGDWTITYHPTTGAATLTATTAHNIQTSARTTHNPIIDAQSQNIEVRPPSGIGTNPVSGTATGEWNGRT